ncbi:hypothetical protein FocnCong_v011687 [Fusarium oxysporum f. sp. conglutinans]|nr:hypothetical protein FocnCong_v011687 [Fusarium oxysporum f. sp. conglutinans]
MWNWKQYSNVQRGGRASGCRSLHKDMRNHLCWWSPRQPQFPTREAESIHVAGYEVDANPLLEENGMADPELDTAMLDAQDGDSGSNGITSPAGSYERVANTMEGVEHGEGKANPPIGRAGSNNHTEGDALVPKTITGTAKAVEQIEANASARTGTETGNISLPDFVMDKVCKKWECILKVIFLIRE